MLNLTWPKGSTSTQSINITMNLATPKVNREATMFKMLIQIDLISSDNDSYTLTNKSDH